MLLIYMFGRQMGKKYRIPQRFQYNLLIDAMTKIVIFIALLCRFVGELFEISELLQWTANRKWYGVPQQHREIMAPT